MTTTTSLAALTVRFQSLLPMARPVDVVGFRSTTPKYAGSSDVLSGEGSRLHGGRWSPIGLRAVYASLTPEAAMAETLAYYRYYNLSLASAMPRLFVAIRFQLAAVIDLTDGDVRKRLRLSEAELIQCDWRKKLAVSQTPITQLVGHAAQLAGFEGLLVRSSAAVNDKNLVAFPGQMRLGSDISLVTP